MVRTKIKKKSTRKKRISSPFFYLGHKIKGLSIKQPWSTLIIDSHKDIENRVWGIKNFNPLDYCNNWIFIQSSATRDKDYEKKVDELYTNNKYLTTNSTTPVSSILGMAHISYIEKNCDLTQKWATGKVCWHIDAVIKFDTPIHAIGMLGTWDPETKIHEQITHQINISKKNIIFHRHK